MRFFYFFIFAILSGSTLFAQDSANANSPVSIRMRCHATLTDSCAPLFIVDGKQFSYEALSKIDPATIQKIDVLKDSKATALYGSRGVNGVVYITLKQQDKYVSRILDEEDSTGINLAAVTFISANNDSTRFMTDEKGEISMGLLDRGAEYNVYVTAFGYKDSLLKHKISGGKSAVQFRIKRDVKELGEVIVQSVGVVCILRRIECKLSVSKRQGYDSVVVGQTTPVMAGSIIFPNPVLRGCGAKIEFNTDDTSPKQIRMLTLNGALISSLTYTPVKGLNRIELPIASHLAAGMYAVQVTDQKGKLSSQHKLLVQ